MVIWDNLNTHQRQDARADRGSIGPAAGDPLPPYAPDLNPAEHVWSHLNHDLANLIVHGIDQLAAIVKYRLKRIQYRPELTDGFFAHTGLTLDPEPL